MNREKVFNLYNLYNIKCNTKCVIFSVSICININNI